MDVAFGMRGAARVVIVDAATTGEPGGTVYRVPADRLAQLPPIDGLHTHNFRWDHALSFSTWLLGPYRPSDITVYLVEAESLEAGAPLTAPVERGMARVIELIERDHYPESVQGRALAAAGTHPAPGPRRNRDDDGCEAGAYQGDNGDGDGSVDSRGARERPVDGLPRGRHPGRGAAAPGADPSQPGEGPAGRGCAAPHGGPTAFAAGGN